MRLDRIMAWVAGLLLLAAVAAPALQAIEWLQAGRWTNLPLALFLGSEFSHPTSWIGLNRIIGWVLDTHVSVFLCALALGPLWALNRICANNLTSAEEFAWANRHGPYMSAASLDEARAMKKQTIKEHR